MKASFRIIRSVASLAAAAALIAGAILMPACSSPAGGPGESGTTGVPSVTEAAPAGVVLIENGRSSVRIVVPDTTGRVKTEEDEMNSAAAVALKKALEAFISDGDQPMGSDWVLNGTHDPEALEILIGKTEYEEGRDDMEKVSSGGYMVRIYGRKIVVFARSGDAYTEAVRKFGALLSEHANDTGSGITVEIPPEELDFSGRSSDIIAAVPSPADVVYSTVYNSGEGCRELIYLNASPEKYRNYVALLKESGFTFYASHEIKRNCFSTLYSAEVTVTVWYYGNERQLRIIVEPFSQATLIGTEADNVFTRVTTPALTMLGVSYTNSYGDTMEHGMCFLIRLSDGRFIVIDGGFNRAEHANSLIGAIKDQAAEYTTDGKYTIAAWIVTHSHEDHNALLNGRYKDIMKAGITVERVILNFLDKDEMKRCIEEWPINWSTGETDTWAGTYRAITGLGADQVVAHVGQVFWFADLKIEVLYTLECIAPEAADAMSSTSRIMKMTFTDPATGQQMVYMSLGDATGKALNHLTKMYGDYLKTDVLQLAHHGMVTFGWVEGTIAAYKAMAPTVLLWPVGEGDYPKLLDKSYNRRAYDPAYNPNIKEVYVGGPVGRMTMLLMPYTLGTAKVIQPSERK